MITTIMPSCHCNDKWTHPSTVPHGYRKRLANIESIVAPNCKGADCLQGNPNIEMGLGRGSILALLYYGKLEGELKRLSSSFPLEDVPYWYSSVLECA